MVFNWKATFVGEGDRYNYGSMCAPNIPCSKNQEKPKSNFYAKGKRRLKALY
jgi:hypothetical protein